MNDDWQQYRPKLALYDVLDKPGGVSVDTALKRAESAMENHRGQATNALTQRVQLLESIAKARTEEGAAQVYEISTFILDIAGIFQPPLCRAAHSLCELVHRMKAADRWDWPAIDVHIGAMRVLMGKMNDRDPAVLSVLHGLGAVVAKYPDPSPLEPPKLMPSSA